MWWAAVQCSHLFHICFHIHSFNHSVSVRPTLSQAVHATLKSTKSVKQSRRTYKLKTTQLNDDNYDRRELTVGMNISPTGCSSVSRQTEQLTRTKKTGIGQLAGITTSTRAKWRRWIKGFVEFVTLDLPCSVNVRSAPTTSLLSSHHSLLLSLSCQHHVHQTALNINNTAF